MTKTLSFFPNQPPGRYTPANSENVTTFADLETLWRSGQFDELLVPHDVVLPSTIANTAAASIKRISSPAANPIAAAITELCQHCAAASEVAGWWRHPTTGQELWHDPHIVPVKLMLIVSELAEAMEAHRRSAQDDKLPHYSGLTVELADAAIRIFDLAGKLQLPLAAAIAEKLSFNTTRPDHKPTARRKPGGKLY